MPRHCHGQSSPTLPPDPAEVSSLERLITSLIQILRVYSIHLHFAFRQSVLQNINHLHSTRTLILKMLYFVGLGLGDAKDITVRGLEIVQRCEKVFLEHYTSILTVGQEELEKFYGREVDIKDQPMHLNDEILSWKVILADRDLVEQGAEEILEGAREKEVVTTDNASFQ